MIQDISPYVYKNEYQSQRPSKNSFAMCFREGNALVKIENGEICFPTFEVLGEQNSEIYETAVYLFAIDEMRFYLVEVKQVPETFEWMPKVQFRYASPAHFAFAGITAHQLSQWYQNHKFCGKCGQLLRHSEKERMLYCEGCHQVEYPKISPAVIVGIIDGDKILLTKYAGREYKKYALVAGFAEIGEAIEDTVRREVMEEVGLNVKNIIYYKSQPWSFTETLLFGFYVEVDGSSHIVMDTQELASAEWFVRDEIPFIEKSVSLTNEMILNFKYGKTKE